MPCAWAVNARPVRVRFSAISGVCSGIVQVIGWVLKVMVEHESAQPRLDITGTETSAAVKVSGCRNVGVLLGTIGSGVACIGVAPLNGLQRKVARSGRLVLRQDGYYLELNRLSIGSSRTGATSFCTCATVRL